MQTDMQTPEEFQQNFQIKFCEFLQKLEANGQTQYEGWAYWDIVNDILDRHLEVVYRVQTIENESRLRSLGDDLIRMETDLEEVRALSERGLEAVARLREKRQHA